MGRIASDATLLRNVKSELSKMQTKCAEWRASSDAFCIRATKAEQESAEWKARFDILLRRDGDA